MWLRADHIGNAPTSRALHRSTRPPVDCQENDGEWMGGICDSGMGIMLDIVSSNISLCVLMCICFKFKVARVHMNMHIISILHIEQVNAWGGCSAITQHITLGVYLTFQSVATFVVVCKLWKSVHASDIAYMHTTHQ